METSNQYSLYAAPSSPHSLGKSIEWKRKVLKQIVRLYFVPTRWGNQLNGNSTGQTAPLVGQLGASPLAGEIN